MPIITVLPQQNRSGTVDSPIWHIPTNLTGTFEFGVDLNLTNLQNTANYLEFKSWVSDNNVDWNYFAGFGWKGGNYLNKNGVVTTGPTLIVKGESIAGKYIKFSMTLNRTMRIGFHVVTV